MIFHARLGFDIGSDVLINPLQDLYGGVIKTIIGRLFDRVKKKQNTHADVFIGSRVSEVDRRLLTYKATIEMTRLPCGLGKDRKHFIDIATVQYFIHSL